MMTEDERIKNHPFYHGKNPYHTPVFAVVSTSGKTFLRYPTRADYIQTPYDGQLGWMDNTNFIYDCTDIAMYAPIDLPDNTLQILETTTRSKNSLHRSSLYKFLAGKINT